MSDSLRKLIDTTFSNETMNSVEFHNSITSNSNNINLSNGTLPNTANNSETSRNALGDFFPRFDQTKVEIGSTSPVIKTITTGLVKDLSTGLRTTQLPVSSITASSQPSQRIQDNLPPSNHSARPPNGFNSILHPGQTFANQNGSNNTGIRATGSMEKSQEDDLDGMPVSPVGSNLTNNLASPNGDSDTASSSLISGNRFQSNSGEPLFKGNGSANGRANGGSAFQPSTATNATVFASSSSNPIDNRFENPNSTTNPGTSTTFISTTDSMDGVIMTGALGATEEDQKPIVAPIPIPSFPTSLDHPVPMVSSQKVKLPKPKPPKITKVKPEKTSKKSKIAGPFIPPFNFSLGQVYQLRRPKGLDLPSEWFCSFCGLTCDPLPEVRSREYNKAFKKVQDASPVGAALVGEHIEICDKLGQWKQTISNLWTGLIENMNDEVIEDRSLYKTRKALPTDEELMEEELEMKRKLGMVEEENEKEMEPEPKKIKISHESSKSASLEPDITAPLPTEPFYQPLETQPELPVDVEVKIPRKRLVKKGPPASQIAGSWIGRDRKGVKYPILSEELMAFVKDRVQDPKREELIQARAMTSAGTSPPPDSYTATIGDMVAQVGMARASSTAEPKVAKVSPVRVPKPPKPAKVFKVKIPNSKPRSSYSREEAMANELRTLQSSHFSVDLTNFGRRTVIPPNIRRAATEQELSELLDPVGKHKKKISFNSNTILPQLPVLSNCDTIDKVVERIILPPGLKENEREKELKDQNLKEIALEKAEIAARTLSVMKKKPRMTYKRKIKLRELVQSRKINFQSNFLSFR